ncbi:MAG: ABC transporter substrate-binding protein [Treponema sp.]|nr:ABC transporter substrate-binding protein [Treponema sp.]
MKHPRPSAFIRVNIFLICGICVNLWFLFSLASCTRSPEMTLSEIEAARAAGANDLIEKTVHRPKTSDDFVPGKVGGTYNDFIMGDPKSFNMLVAEKDGETAGVIAPLVQYLADYDVVERKWKGHIADFEIKVYEEEKKLDVIYTIKDDVYWSFYENAKPRVKVTSDDVIFWYDEIQGDEECGSSAYNSQFMPLEDGTEERITIEKIDDARFVFHFPTIIAEPILHTNMNFGPRFLYKAAKDSGGADAVKKLFTVAADPREIPSCGPYFLVEYKPGQRLLYKRNPDCWNKDANGISHYYPEEMVLQIIGDTNTAYLLFKQGKIEDYSFQPEQVEEAVKNAKNALTADGKKLDSLVEPVETTKTASTDGYTVFNADGAMNASFWSFNQNPKNKEEAYYDWFCKKEFRQAMSCLLNRERIISQTYRGLGEPTYSFFPEANKYYDENIILQYRFSHAHAQKLLESAGFSKHSDGLLYDEKGRKVEFDISFNGSAAILSDIAQIITDECKKEGITVNARPTDFQKLVEQLMTSYDWQTILIGFGGGSLFPTQGSNVWVSDGNLHLWNPLQETPATDWEARVDELYHTAKCISDYEKAKPYWDEYQKIFLEQCPIVYLIRSRSFFGLQNRWDMTNVYYDNLNGAETSYLWLK